MSLVPERALRRGLRLTAFARAGAVIDLVTVPLFTWLIGLPAYGVYLVMAAAVTLGSGSLDLAMATVLQRVVPRAESPEAAARAIKAALLLAVLPGCVIAIAVLLFATAIATQISAAPAQRATLATAVRIFVLAFPLTAFVEVAAAAVRAARVFGPEIRLRVLWEQLLRVGLALVLYPAIGWLALPVAHVVSLAAMAVLALQLAGRVHGVSVWSARPAAADFRRLAGLGVAFIPANLARRALADLPPIILDRLIPGAGGATAAALYGIARKLASVVQLAGTVFGYVLAPLTTAAARAGEAARLYVHASRLALLVAVPLGAVVAIAAAPLLAIFIPSAVAAAPIAAILIAGRTIEAAASPATALVEMLGPRRWPVLNAVAAAGSALAAAALLPHDARDLAIAVSIGLSAASLFALVQANWLVRQQAGS